MLSKVRDIWNNLFKREPTKLEYIMVFISFAMLLLEFIKYLNI